jgi:hypothetical protein
LSARKLRSRGSVVDVGLEIGKTEYRRKPDTSAENGRAVVKGSLAELIKTNVSDN